MSLSTNSVIHYTNKFENLKNILCDQSFKLKYCVENLEFFTAINFKLAINMVCFCDIPLSEVKNHIDSYGYYGIGLSKQWAKKNGLNPVLYLEKDSILSKTFDSQLNRYIKLKDGEEDTHKENIDDFFEFIKYVKMYEGPLKSGKVNNDNYRFYNEREWRFSLDNKTIDKNKIEGILTEAKYLKDKDILNENLNSFRLNFTFDDISYMIINDESEIPELLKCINDNFETKCNARELKILSTKILTSNQICNDF